MNHFLRTFMFICVLLFSLIIGKTDVAYGQFQEEITVKVNQFVEAKMNEENIPNLAVSIVHDGEIIFEKGYGYADIELQTPVDPTTSLFRIGSVSKLMTWVLSCNSSSKER